MFTKLGSKNTFSIANINGYVKNNNLCVNIKYTFTDLTYKLYYCRGDFLYSVQESRSALN